MFFNIHLYIKRREKKEKTLNHKKTKTLKVQKISCVKIFCIADPSLVDSTSEVFERQRGATDTYMAILVM